MGGREKGESKGDCVRGRSGIEDSMIKYMS